MTSPEASSRLIFWPVLRRCALLGAGVDVLLFFLFHYLGSPVLAWINLLSLSMYLLAYYLLRHGRSRVAVALMWLEVLGHSTLGIFMLGWDSGVYYYMLLFIPLIVASAKPRRAFPAVVGLWTYYLGLYLMSQLWLEPIQPISHEAALTIHAFSITIVFAMLSYLSHLYIRAVYAAQKRLRLQASTDALTGLFNRRHALEVADHEIARRKRSRAPLSLIIADIDHFKLINDSLGHEGGDQALRAISALLRRSLRTQDIVARWGGEEFLLILPETDIHQALEIAERLRHQVDNTPLVLEGQTSLAMSLTLGVSQHRDDESLDECIGRADRSLYRGKQQGRNRVEH